MISKKIGIYAIYAASFMFLISSIPEITLAKQNGKEKNESKKEERIDKKESKKIEKNTKNCIKAFGHLFAKGWIKNNSAVQLEDVCFIPFGINKKFNGVSTTTVDNAAPIISNVSANSNIGKAVITWSTDEKSDSYVLFSTTNPVNTNSSSTPIHGNNSKVKNHWVTISNLSAGTTYYYVVRSKDNSGNIAYSGQSSFTTITPPTTNDTGAPNITNIVGMISTTSVQIGWRTNEFTTSKVYYSQNTPIDVNTANFIQNTSLNNYHLINITGLNSATKYNFIIESKDNAGNISRSNEFSHTTLSTNTPADTTAPTISSVSNSASSTTINVLWTTNEPSTSKVYYNLGTTVDANSTTTPYIFDSNLVINHVLSIPSLSSSTQYTLVIESRDSLNNRALSNTFSITTNSN